MPLVLLHGSPILHFVVTLPLIIFLIGEKAKAETSAGTEDVEEQLVSTNRGDFPIKVYLHPLRVVFL